MIKRSTAPPPWRHESELAMVRDWFYAQHARADAFSAPPGDMRQRAVDRVNLWLFKAGALPPAVLSTASLTEAVIHHDRVRKTTGDDGRALVDLTISGQALQSIYAMAFARFVNAFVDRDVARAHTADLMVHDSSDDGDETTTNTGTGGNGTTSTARGESSMYAHAATIGMPEAFVDLRHQVAHGELPSLIYLRKMTLSALEWLWERWWVKNATGDPTRALLELAERRQLSMEVQMARNHEHQGLDIESPESG
ncbi:hypothetical protein LTR84_009204 [Exophiala bonariae]|uniref:Uncharacterized protein n=1 Tax=Exophiala bonariae TaxID=1690606 RepID=A0AAV9MVT6_9EURO|nr:hypothetical protein LTR84_009204 [Exophiala bonariae]